MMKDSAFVEKVKAATPEKPVRVAVLSQDATSTSVTQRTQGFIDTFKAAAEEIFPDQVAVEGHDLYAVASAQDPAVIISVHIAPTTDAADLKNIGSAALQEDNLIGVFCSNEGSVTGFLNATDLADYLVTKGLPFRSAYKVSGQLVAYCIAHNTVLEKLPLETFRTFSDLFDDGVYDAIDLKNCVTRRVSYGGTSVPSVEAQITWVTQQLEA